MLNRAALYERIDRLLADAAGGVVGVLFLRASRFREFAAMFGYAATEALEEEMRRLLARTLRPVDVVHPLGEGGFALLLPNLHGPNHAVLAATRLVSAFENSFVLDGSAISLPIAIGISLGPEHGTNADLLCRHAETAYADSLQQSERFAVYRPEAEIFTVSGRELSSAIEHQRLEVHLQPIRSLRTGELVGAESLARWQSPAGSISPKLFVSLAEQTGLIAGLTHWSINTTLRYAAASRGIRGDLFFAINLSARALRQTDLVEQIQGALAIWDVPASSLVLELTETSIMEDPVYSARMLARLRENGVRIAIDDFGTGYSSFAYLRNLPATELKIDISFVAGISGDVRAAQLVRSMIDLAHYLDMAVVAEGVEDSATLSLLQEMGCDMAQGYYIGMPEPADAFIAHCGME
jgi:EAL domain-containing protein (putative c-di-GMP-specific phosphodiesterase class I)/GGDEF domain-containing protein